MRFFFTRLSSTLIAASFILLAGCQSAGGSLDPVAPIPGPAVARSASSVTTGVVIPMYIDPGSSPSAWDEVIAQKKLHPAVPILLIANPNSGPGTYKEAQYVTYIAKERAAGVKVIGYVATGYTQYKVAPVEAQMHTWALWYHVDGIFLDEADSYAKPFFTTVTAYAHAHSLPLVMANPGTDAPANLGADVINYFEQKGYPSLAFLKKPAHLAAGSKRWSYMAGAVPYNAATIAASAKYVAYIYATDGAEPECYCKLPSYLPQLVTLLSKL